MTLPEAGLCVLRDAKATRYLMIKFGPHGGCHGHFDKPGVLYAHDNHGVLMDAGTARYSSPLHEEWYRSTLAHNTIAIDGLRQLPCAGHLVRAGDGTATVSVSPYDGVRVERTVALTEHGVSDGWKIECDRPRRIEILYHFPAPKDGSTYAIPSRARIEGSDPAYRYLADPETLEGPLPPLDFEGFSLRFSWKATAAGTALKARTPGISGSPKGGLVLLLRFEARSLEVNAGIEVGKATALPVPVASQAHPPL